MKQIITILIAALTMMSCANNPGAQDNSRAVLDNILSRKSVRSYTEQDVTPEQVETILKAAMAAARKISSTLSCVKDAYSRCASRIAESFRSRSCVVTIRSGVSVFFMICSSFLLS